MLISFLNLVRIYYCYTFDLIALSPATEVCLLLRNNSAVESQKAVSVYFKTKRILRFRFSGQNGDPCRPTLNSLDLFHDTICIQAHLKVSGSFKSVL